MLVKQRGDDALIEFTNKFDQRQVKIDNIEVPLERLQAATDRIPAENAAILEICS